MYAALDRIEQMSACGCCCPNTGTDWITEMKTGRNLIVNWCITGAVLAIGSVLTAVGVAEASGRQGAGAELSNAPGLRDECEVIIHFCEDLSVGEVFTFNAEGSPPGGEYEWSVSQPGGQLSPDGGEGSQFVVTAAEPSNSVADVQVSVTYTAPGGDQCTTDCTLTVMQFVVRNLTFGGSSFKSVTKDCQWGTCPPYETPHWLDTDLDGEATGYGEHDSPVSYKREATVVLSDVLFDAKPADLGQNAVFVRGVGPDGVMFVGFASLMGGEVSVYDDMVATGPLPSMVNVYDTFDIQWQVALSNYKLHPAGASRNVMYVTLGSPSGNRLESFFDISTRAADGEATTQDAIDAIWGGFSDLYVENAHSEPMGYYRGILCASDCTVYDAQGLVVLLNGQCGAWRDLLVQCFRTQGIYGAQYVDVEPISGSGFIVNDYQFASGEGTSGCSSYPYRFNSPCGGPAWPAGTVEVTDQDGIPGQDNYNPASYFGRHFIVKINEKYYDPSYGVGPIEGTTEDATLIYEQGAIAGYHSSCGIYRAVRKDVYEVREIKFSK